jgi:prefoldin alpha subunit
MNELNSQRDFLIKGLIDARTGLAALNGLTPNSDSQVLVPLGGGIFASATMPPTKMLFVGIGADVIIEKSKEETINYLTEREKNMENAVLGVDSQRKDINARLIEKRDTINKIISKKQG